MPLDDEDATELLRRRLEDEVKANVEDKLFRYYRNVGSAIIAILGLVGISVGWPTLKNSIDSQIKEQIRQQVSDPVALAKQAAQDATNLATRSLVEIRSQQDTLHDSLGRLGPKFDDIQVSFGEANQRLIDLQEASGELQQITKFLRDQVQSEPVKREEIVALEERIGGLVEQIQKLTELIEHRAAAPAAAEGIEDVKVGLADIATTQARIIDQATDKDPRTTSTVYVQFAGGRRSDIERIGDIIRDEGWRVPGEERTAAAARKREIRYFHDSDEAAAKKLKTSLDAALIKAGFPEQSGVKLTKLDAQDFKSQPVEGILEVWLEIPVR